MKEYSPLTLSEALHYANLCKKVPREQAETMQRFLMQRALETNVTSPDVTEIIQSITDRFVEEEREMLRKRMDEYVRRLGISEQQRIDATDEQIVKAIKWTLDDFESEKDWGGIYRILVDYCQHLGFTATKTSFVRRFAKMGIYPKDNVVGDTDRSLPPAIFKDEYNGNPFSYYAIDKGLGAYWPASYNEWKTSDITTNDFIQRRKIAALFLKNLVKATEGQ